MIETYSPEVSEVPGAVSKRVTESEAPCGTFYTTEFFDAAGEVIRTDQCVYVKKEALPELFGGAQL